MTDKEILLLRLANHQLAGSDIKEPHKIVSWMGAMQSQNYEMAKWGIGCRIHSLTSKDIEKSFNEGEIIRLHILRPTWHFVSKDDIYWMLYLSAHRVKMANNSADKVLGLTDALIKKTNSIIEKALRDNTHLTREELKNIINGAGIEADNRRVNHIMFRAETSSLVCNGAMRGKKQTYALLEERVPRATDIFDKDECLYRLAYKYFRSHGPATLHDFIWWSGLTTADCRRAVELIKEDFIFETVEGQTYIFHRESVPTNEVHLINLLPAFDEFIVSYKDRKETLHIDHHKKIITSPGIFQPSISKDGKTIGSWKKASTKKDIITAEYFETVNISTEKLISKAAERFKAYML